MSEVVHQALLAKRASIESKDGPFWAWLRSIDAFPKFDVEYLRLTWSGGIGSVLCFAIMAYLMISELWRWAMPTISHEFVVDKTVQSTMPIDFQISVATPCEMLMVMVADHKGQVTTLNNKISVEEVLFPKDAVRKKVYKPTLKEVKGWRKEAERKGILLSDNEDFVPPEGYVMGCRLIGSFDLDRVDGNLLIVPVTDFLGVLGDLIMMGDKTINFSHIIHYMRFGKDYPGLRNPLNGSSQPAMQFHEDFTYFLSILPTRYQGLFSKDWIRSNQYSLTSFLGQKDSTRVDKPSLAFRYTIEPLSVAIRYPRNSLRKFLLHLAGILGGIYTCFGIIASLFLAIADWLTGAYTLKKRRTSSLVSAGSVPMSEMANLAREGPFEKENLLEPAAFV